ncbi:MAG: hypothetical protein ACI37T_04255, partial [Candidatus Gastranaerophilaceae bacterium]
ITITNLETRRMDITKLKTKNWQHKRGSIGEVVTEIDDIAQCVASIMEITKGSVPLCPELGTDVIEAIGENTEDAIEIATAIFAKEIPIQEPRCELLDITGEKDENGKIIIKPYIQAKQTGKTKKIERYINV